MTGVSGAAAAEPGVHTLSVLAGLDPAGLSAAALVDAVIASERLLAHVNGLQVRLLAELGLPNRCADVTDLVAALVDKAGVGRGADGLVDPEVVAAETADRSVGVAAAEVAAVLDCSPVTARIRIRQAMRMVSALPLTAAALEQGRVDVGRARMLVDRTQVLAADLCGGVERRMLPLVKGRSKARLETLVDREVIAADPAAAENRRLAAIRDRSVSHRVDKDGMGVITALLPAEAAVLVFTLVDLIAAPNKGLDGRSVDQRRADAIADIADELLTYGFVDLDHLVARVERSSGGARDADADNANPADADADSPADAAKPADGSAADADADAVVAATNGGGAVSVPDVAAAAGDRDADRAARLVRAGTRHGRRPHLMVTGAWTTLAGLDDLPGHLDGYGTITADLLRAIATSWGTVTTIGVDPASGMATAVGGLTYRPGRRVCDQVIAVSGTCRAAGCRIPAAKCDLDHVVPFDHADPAAGGRTTAADQIPLCRFHHLLKHHTDWTPHLRPDLTVVWTTVTGHTATSYPREFIAPGEWERAADSMSQTRCTAAGVDLDARLDSDRGGAMRTGAPGGQVIIGPVVTGPTIPVIPAGTDYTEPHTELEDPGTVPHPGSVEINTYRAVREDTRWHALRRIRRLTPPDPTRDTSPAQAERQQLDRHWRAAQQQPHPQRPADHVDHGGAALLDLAASKTPLPDEPPF